jgi:hypothetical protein
MFHLNDPFELSMRMSRLQKGLCLGFFGNLGWKTLGQIWQSNGNIRATDGKVWEDHLNLHQFFDWDKGLEMEVYAPNKSK